MGSAALGGRRPRRRTAGEALASEGPGCLLGCRGDRVRIWMARLRVRSPVSPVARPSPVNQVAGADRTHQVRREAQSKHKLRNVPRMVSAPLSFRSSTCDTPTQSRSHSAQVTKNRIDSRRRRSHSVARPTNNRPASDEARMTILDRLHAPRLPGLGVTLLALLIIGPVTLAHASPPDQTWLAGVYDQADFDDVVVLLTSALDATDSTAVPGAGASFGLAPRLCAATVACPASAPAYSPPLRAPPIF